MQYFTKFLITVLLLSVFPQLYSNDDIRLFHEHGIKFIDLPKDYMGPFFLTVGTNKAIDYYKREWDADQYNFVFNKLFPKFVKKFNILEYVPFEEVGKESPNNPIIIRIDNLIVQKLIIKLGLVENIAEYEFCCSVRISIYQNIPVDNAITSIFYADNKALLFGSMDHIGTTIEQLLFNTYEELKARSQIN